MASLFLRALALAAKFILLVVMARYLSLADIGRYGLVVATVNILSRLAGLEFYTVANRALVVATDPERWRILNGLALVVGAGLLATAPLCWAVTRSLDLGIGWLPLLGILVAHQVGAESGRILVAVGQPFRSYLVGALVNGVWPVALIAVWWLAPARGTLDSVWAAWLVGAALGAAWGVAEVARSLRAPWRSGAPDGVWMRRALRSAGLFLVGDVAFRTIEFADRFIVDFFLGTAAVGVYTYYSSVTKFISELPTVLVMVPMFPESVAVVQRGRRGEARRVLRRLTLRSVALAVASAPLLFGGLWAVTRAMDKPEIWSAPAAFAILLGAGIVLTASKGAHHALYGAERERTIMWITAVAAATNLATGILLTPVVGMAGAAMGTLTAMLALLVGKHLAARTVMLGMEE